MFKDIVGAVGGLFSKPVQLWQERKTLTESAQQARTTLKIEQRHELEKLAHEAKVAKANTALEMAKQSQVQDYDLDRIAMKNMQNSWKDELVLIIFLIPFILAFIPSMAPHIKAGFLVIDGMPEWVVALIIGMVVVIYGLRGLLKSYLSRGFTLGKSTPKNTVTPKTNSGHPGINEVL